jgi:2-succinyl-5-enolpyruvyl-6-hydroxy-3-cyclohexene-1-carboxylate synthase
VKARPLRAFVDELARGGIREAVVCPGSRSTPLALALRAHPAIRVRVLLDERAAGFFALGLARVSRRPVALLATSGTAAVNFAPAVVEALADRVPLVVLTADRPPELRDRGAPQTIDQVRLYGTHAKWWAELPVFEDSPELVAHLRSVAGRAVATASAMPAGPVHLNVPFREPLIPEGELGAAGDDPAERTVVPGGGGPFTAVMQGRRAAAAADVAVLAQRLAATERGLIVAGPQDEPGVPAAIARLAAATGYPILADPLSQLRLGPHDRSHVVARADLLVRRGTWIDAHRPDLVVRFGAMPTSKAILQFLQTTRPAQLVVDSGDGWREAALLPSVFVHADAAVLAEALAEALTRAAAGSAVARPDHWADDWLAADRTASEALDGWLATLVARDEPFEPLPFVHLADLLPDGGILWVGSSMPVRDLDTFLSSGPRAVRCLANRGANGIDGVVSSALGAAAADEGPVVLVVGDLSFLNDLNALVIARLHRLAATIVLLNNDGGGIFSFLPQARAQAPGVGLPEAYEELFGTPHGIDVGPIVAALGGEHRVIAPGQVRAALAASIGAPGIRVLELRSERARNVELHREAAAAVAHALAALPTPGRSRGAGR